MVFVGLWIALPVSSNTGRRVLRQGTTGYDQGCRDGAQLL